jgi:hypothetical protein
MACIHSTSQRRAAACGRAGRGAEQQGAQQEARGCKRCGSGGQDEGGGVGWVKGQVDGMGGVWRISNRAAFRPYFMVFFFT